MYDLNYKTPTVIHEVASTDMLLDQDHFVETGFQLHHMQDGGTRRSIELFQTGGLALEKLNGQICGVYRCHSDIDVFETKQLLRMRSQGLRPKKIDIDVLWANFDSENLISLFKDDPDMIEFLSESL